MRVAIDADAQLIPDNKIDAASFRSRYKIMSQIGKGAFGTVSTCKEKSTGLIYAVKIIDKAKVAK